MTDIGEIFAEEIVDDVPVDVEMVGDDTTSRAGTEIPAPSGADDGDNLPFQEDNIEDISARVTYIDYLRSPIIGLLVGQGDEQALLTAHQALLVQSPWFADACAKFSNDVSVSYLSQKGR